MNNKKDEFYQWWFKWLKTIDTKKRIEEHLWKMELKQLFPRRIRNDK